MPYAANGNVRLFYETFGRRDASPLLLINGLGSQCINYRTEWCERFTSAGFFVIRFDNRDVGLSTHFDDVEPDLARVTASVRSGEDPDVPYTLSDMAGDALAVLDEVGVERAHVMGLSMGGMIAQTLAIEHPHRLLSMTSVMSTTGDPDVGRPSPEARALLFGPRPTDRDSYVARQVASIRTYGSPGWFDEERVAAQANEAFDRCFDPAGTTRQLMAITASGSRTSALRSVRTPTLVIHGEVDKLIDASGGKRTAEAIPGARFELIEGMGHDYPPQVWDRVVELVAAHARAATA